MCIHVFAACRKFCIFFEKKKILENYQKKPTCHHGQVDMFLACLQRNFTRFGCADECFDLGGGVCVRIVF